MAYLHSQRQIPFPIPIPVLDSWDENLNLTSCSVKSSAYYKCSHLVCPPNWNQNLDPVM